MGRVPAHSNGAPSRRWRHAFVYSADRYRRGNTSVCSRRVPTPGRWHGPHTRRLTRSLHRCSPIDGTSTTHKRRFRWTYRSVANQGCRAAAASNCRGRLRRGRARPDCPSRAERPFRAVSERWHQTAVFPSYSTTRAGNWVTAPLRLVRRERRRLAGGPSTAIAFHASSPGISLATTMSRPYGIFRTAVALRRSSRTRSGTSSD